VASRVRDAKKSVFANQHGKSIENQLNKCWQSPKLLCF
jgi:hypothetical protein